MAGNCKNSLVSYGILENGGGVRITAFGRQLHEIADETEQCEALVKHILKNLNGMILIDVCVVCIAMENGFPRKLSLRH